MALESMRKPSRFMPKYVEKSTGISGWLIASAFFLMLGWFIYKAPVILAIVPVLVAVEIKNSKARKSHFSKLREKRNKDSICTFSRYFDCKSIDTWVIRAVYEQLQNYISSDSIAFPIKPTDNVFKDLLIDDEDFELDIVEEIAQRTGRTLDHAENNPYYGKANVVENLVYFFNEQPVAT
ncbi:hypothetical protein ACJJIR_08675 [Microbulbifer sp. SSSA008]|uniref:hypothetical protein n=1 Tax=Microbulbifer sp. SSSA008 TaxID=3243380 RepID=UPI0040396E5C